MLPFELTKDTPYLALSGKLWSVFYEYFNRNWSCYKGFLLYEWNHRQVIFKLNLVMDYSSGSYEIAFGWIALDSLTKSQN